MTGYERERDGRNRDGRERGGRVIRDGRGEGR